MQGNRLFAVGENVLLPRGAQTGATVWVCRGRLPVDTVSSTSSSSWKAEPEAQVALRTVILTVDDDAEVSRAVARDLRRRYGKEYRIVRAESGDQGLEALRELKLRGDQVCLLLADYRMPEMSGIEFLEQAMDLFPSARRVLLTAYADTGAAINAINAAHSVPPAAIPKV